MDSVTGADTAWSTYTGASFSSCAFSIVPSIITRPIMSSRICDGWTDSTTFIQRDSLDTCVITVADSAETIQYTIDMARGVIIGLELRSSTESVSHRYFYGYDQDIYFLKMVSCTNWDTTIQYGGYQFTNIRINGEAVTSKSGRIQREIAPFTLHPIGPGSDRAVLTGGGAGMRLAVFDLAGRNLFDFTLQGGETVLDLNRRCGGAGCPSGPLVLRSAGRIGAAAFSTVIIR